MKKSITFLIILIILFVITYSITPDENSDGESTDHPVISEYYINLIIEEIGEQIAGNPDVDVNQIMLQTIEEYGFTIGDFNNAIRQSPDLAQKLLLTIMESGLQRYGIHVQIEMNNLNASDYFNHDQPKLTPDIDRSSVQGLIVELESYIIWQAEIFTWHDQRDDWIQKVLTAESIPEIAVSLYELEASILPEYLDSRWWGIRQYWREIIDNCSSLYCLKMMIFQLYSVIISTGFYEDNRDDLMNWQQMMIEAELLQPADS